MTLNLPGKENIVRTSLERTAWMVLAAAALFSCGCGSRSGGPPHVQFAQSPHAAMQNLPFSEAVRVGDMLYLSGQLGTHPGTLQVVPGGIEAETRQCLENIKAVLERNGSSLGRVVKCSVFLADISEWPTFNEIYRTYFPASPPARSALAASGLALGARVEVECIAVVGSPGGD